MSKLTLFCFPCSGSSAMSYYRWRRLLPESVEIRPVELPGRGSRISDPFVSDFSSLVEQLTREIEPLLTQHYALFGHSLGGLLAYACAAGLCDGGKISPQALFVASCAAPSARSFDFSDLVDDEDLIRQLRHLKGTPSEVFESEELLQLTLAAARADFAVCASHKYATREPLKAPIFVFGGLDDDIARNALAAWQKETAQPLTLNMFAGGHFFLREQEEQFMHRFREQLQSIRQRTAIGIQRTNLF